MAEILDETMYSLQSILMQMMIKLGENVKTKKGKKLIDAACTKELRETLLIPEHIIYLDFELKFDKFGDSVIVIAKNIITALWFSGLYPINVEEVLTTGKFYLGDGYYTFDKKSNMLNFFILK